MSGRLPPMTALDFGDLKFEDVGFGMVQPQRYGRFDGMIEISSVALVHKADGAVGDRPSLAFICSGGPSFGAAFVHQISLASLAAALAEAGYELRDARA